MIASRVSGFGRYCRRATAAAVVAFALIAPASAYAQSASVLFERAKALEDRLGDSPTVDALRKAARAYEAVVLRYPNNGLVDNALWQEAALFERAFERSADPKDRADAAKALEWLAKDYPASPMVKQASARAAALRAAPATPTSAATPPPAPSPTPAPAATGQTPAAVLPPSQSPIVRSITRTSLPRGDRITVELTSEVTFYGERVMNPDRLFFDFPKTGTAIALAEQLKTLPSPIVKGVRVGNPSAGVTRAPPAARDAAPRARRGIAADQGPWPR